MSRTRDARRPRPRSAGAPGFAAPEEVEIGVLGAQGDGLVRDSGGPARFVPFTLPGERVRAAFDGERGELLEVLSASADRSDPICPHFGVCGGCALQHLTSSAYLQVKTDRLRSILERAGLGAPLEAGFLAAPGERRRLALHARRDGAGVRLGLKGRRSWDLAPMETCPVAAPAIVAALPALARLARPFLRGRDVAPILHVTATLTGLAVDVTGVGRGRAPGADELLETAAAAEAADLAEISVEGEIALRRRPPMVRHGDVEVVLPPGGFLQASARAEAFMAGVVTSVLAGTAAVADLFAGSGAFALPLARTAQVWALDSSAAAVAALEAGARGRAGGKPVRAETRDLFRHPVSPVDLRSVGGVVLDPPRAGAEAQCRALAESRTPVLAYVSCNPTTFARDAAVLRAGGFELARVWPVDQFLYSPHMELVGEFRR